MLLTLIVAALATWLVTKIVTESYLFEPVRYFLTNRQYRAITAERRSRHVWGHAAYFVTCNLCAGTWLALLVTLVTGPIVGAGILGWLVTGLAVKGAAHLLLSAEHVAEAKVIQLKWS